MRFYLAGCETEDRILSLSAGAVRNAFCSYLYADKDVPSTGLVTCRKYCQSVIIDSGAHSFFNADPNKLHSATPIRAMKSMPEPKKYFGEYLDWLDGNRSLYDYFVELDIGSIVGQKQVEKWRDEIAARGLAEKCIVVHHPGVEKWPQFWSMAKKFPSQYVGFEGIIKERLPIDYNAVIRPCYDAGIKVHGFAMIKPKWLRLIPFYSADSTSWLAGAVYGLSQVTTKTGMLRAYLSKPTTKNQKQLLATMMLRDGGTEVVLPTTKGRVMRSHREKFAAQQYATLEDQFTAYWKRKGIDWDARINQVQAQAKITPPVPEPTKDASVADPSSRLLKLKLTEVIPAAWNYKQAGSRSDIDKLKQSILRDRSAGIPAVRLLEDGTYEVIDGNHRLVALTELGVSEYLFENFGSISQAEAVTVARRRNHQWFEDDLVKLSELVRDIVVPEIDTRSLSEFMPEDQAELDRIIALANFNWEALPEPPASKTTTKLHFLATAEIQVLFRKWQRIAYAQFKLRDNTDILVKALQIAVATAERPQEKKSE